MKSRIIVGVLLIGLTGFLIPSVPAFAASFGSTTKVKVKAASLTISAPAQVDMGEITVDVEDQTVTGVISDIVVTDLRGKKTPLGWSATVTATEFLEETDRTLKIPFTKMTLEVPSPAQGAAAANSHFSVRAGDPADITFFSTTRGFPDADNDGTSDPISLMSAPSGHGAGRYSLSVVLKLLVPAFQPAGTYSAVLTETVS